MDNEKTIVALILGALLLCSIVITVADYSWCRGQGYSVKACVRSALFERMER